MPRLDFETIVPFQCLGVLPWLSGRVHTPMQVLTAIAVVLGLAQPMILTRTFDQKGWRDRLAYLGLHEAYAALTIGLIVALPALLAR